MHISKELRDQLNSLSEELFGSSSKWTHLVGTGHPQLITCKVKKTIPGVDGTPDTEEETDAPLLRPDGAEQYVMKYYTVEDIVDMMFTLKKQKDEAMAALEKQRAEAEAKARQEAEKAQQEAEAKKTVAGAGGSAI